MSSRKSRVSEERPSYSSLPLPSDFFFLIMIYFFGFAPLTPADCPGGGARLRRNHLTASEWSLCDVVAERVPGG